MISTSMGVQAFSVQLFNTDNESTLSTIHNEISGSKVFRYLFNSSRTELAVLASSPVVGSSKNRTDGSIISSIPMFVLFLSPPEMPRVICVPTWGKHPHKSNTTGINQSVLMLTWCLEALIRWLLKWLLLVTGTRVCKNLGVSHFGETQFFDEMIDSSLLVALWDGAGQPESCRKV